MIGFTRNRRLVALRDKIITQASLDDAWAMQRHKGDPEAFAVALMNRRGAELDMVACPHDWRYYAGEMVAKLEALLEDDERPRGRWAPLSCPVIDPDFDQIEGTEGIYR